MLFYICTIIFFYIIVYFMPKHLQPLEMYTTTWFALTFVLSVDAYLYLIHNLYGYFKEDPLTIKTLIVVFALYPAYNAIFLNFLPRKKRILVLYILGHALFLLTYEWTSTKVGAFHYNGWKLGYSAIAYPIILVILYLNFKLIQILKNKKWGNTKEASK